MDRYRQTNMQKNRHLAPSPEHLQSEGTEGTVDEILSCLDPAAGNAIDAQHHVPCLQCRQIRLASHLHLHIQSPSRVIKMTHWK